MSFFETSPLGRRLVSRKFWAGVGASVIVVFGEALGADLTEGQVWGIVTIAASYIFGQGAVDFITTLRELGAHAQEDALKVDADGAASA